MVEERKRHRGQGYAKSDYHYVYVLRCANGNLYTGYARDPERRVRLHNLGVASKFTRSHRPVALVHLERYGSKSEALRREIKIKKMKRNEKLDLCKL